MIGEGLCRERAARRAPRRSRGWAAGGRPTQREALWPCGRFFPGTGWTRGSVAESVLAAKRSTPPQYQGTGRSRVLYREEDE